jgi:TonB family protein
VAAALTLPPSGGGGSPKPARRLERPRPAKKHRIEEMRQPSERSEPETDSSATTSEADSGGDSGDGGDGSGPGGPGKGPGSGLGAITGTGCLDLSSCTGTELPTLPEAVDDGPKLMPPTVLGKLVRTAGDPQIRPPSSTTTAMLRDGKAQVTALVRMCLDRSGRVIDATVVTSSGYADYDARLRTGVKRWRYQPYSANGRPIAICTHITFVYRQE